MSKSEIQKFHLPLQEASVSITEVNSLDYERELSEEQLEAIAGARMDDIIINFICFNRLL